MSSWQIPDTFTVLHNTAYIVAKLEVINATQDVMSWIAENVWKFSSGVGETVNFVYAMKMFLMILRRVP